MHGKVIAIEAEHKNHGQWRISLKAIIKNSNGEVLVVREKGSCWNLPGGGLEPGEDVLTGLSRELYEEVLLAGNFTAQIIACHPMYVKSKQVWQMWMVFDVVPDNWEFGKGEDADAIAFKDPTEFQGSKFLEERLVYKYAYKKEYAIE